VSPNPIWLTEDEIAVLQVLVDYLIPPDPQAPGALAAGAVDYIDRFLGAFEVDPPFIWAGGATSGRFGGPAEFGDFHRLSPIDEIAWRTRIEGSNGIPEREFNGPVVGLQQRYRKGLAALGTAFVNSDPEARREQLRANREFASLVFEHVCEAVYGAPEYGGNSNAGGWESIEFAGDVQPRGWTDAEVAEP
jgi:Gluconate 2-dehydrogenase subunit 3